MILDHLPPTSHYMIAKRNDPDVALTIAEAMREARATGQGSGYRPPAEEWDTPTDLLAMIADRLGEIEALLASMPVATDKNGKPVKRAKPPKQVPRPRTAIEEAERVLSEAHVDDIIADVESSYMTDDEYRAHAAEMERYRQAAAGGPAE